MGVRVTAGSRDFGRFIGTAPVMRRLYEEIQQVAVSDERVLIYGETGTGKKLATSEIRDRSVRCDGPYVVLNCAGFDHSLIERELFGHVRGAFTGATESKKGLFEAAHNGIFLLDEVASMPPQLQARLLDVLESGEVRRIGTTEPRRVNVRVLAATNQHLDRLVETGEFREDLYWRLAVAIISIPSLRARRQDIPRLVEHLAQQCVPWSLDGDDGAPLQFSPGAMEFLIQAEWRGNVRQLEYLVHRINLRHRDRSKPVGRRTIEREIERCLGGGTPRTRRSLPELSTLREMEEEHIRHTLEATNGSPQRTSEVLGIGRSTVYRKLRSYNIRLSEYVSQQRAEWQQEELFSDRREHR